MKKRTKKIIAREFLILLSSSILFFIVSIIIDYYGDKKYDEIWSNRHKLNELKDELKSASFNYNGRDYTYNELVDKYGERTQEAIEKFDFVKSDENVELINDIKFREIEISKLEDSIFNNSSHLILVVFWIIVLIIYGLRPLFYATKWSIKELKTTANNM